MSGNQTRADIRIHRDRVELVGDVTGESVELEGSLTATDAELAGFLTVADVELGEVESLTAELATIHARLDYLETYHEVGRPESRDERDENPADIDLPVLRDIVQRKREELDDLQKELRGIHEALERLEVE